MSLPRIYITGLGSVSAIGFNVPEHLESLIAGKHGILHLEHLQSRFAGELPFGEVKRSDEEFYALLGIRDGQTTNRTSLLGMTAAREALDMAGGDIQAFRTAFISSTTVGGMTQTEKFFYQFDTHPETRKWIDKLDCGDSTRDIANFLGHRGFLSTLSTACSSAANAIIFGANLIRTGLVDRAVCGGADALSRFTINGFHSLMLLEKEPCHPFDKDRKGLNLGEGAGYIVLEGEHIAEPAKRPLLAELIGYANTNDAFHQTAASPDGSGAYTAMQKTLDMASLAPSEISYINCHGTGTPNNDESESKGMERLFGNSVPPYSSTKAFTGHTLAAAGGIEAVFSVLSILHGSIWPNLNLRNPIGEFAFQPETRLRTGENIRYVLSNSFGFGGNNSSLLFAKVES